MSALFDPLFRPLRERLLRGGVGRRRARRYVAELQDHLDDLVAEEMTAGASLATARERALARLGDLETLAGAMTGRRELRAWSARAPAVVYVMAPPLALGLGAGLALAGLVLLINVLRSGGGAVGGAVLPGWTSPLAQTVVVFINAALAVVLGWGLAVGATLARAPWRWPLLGFVALALAGAALRVEVILPLAGVPGEVELHSVFDGPWLASGGFGERVVVSLVAMLAPYLALGVWRAERALEERVS